MWQSTSGSKSCKIIETQGIPKYSKLYKDAINEAKKLGLDCVSDADLEPLAEIGEANENHILMTNKVIDANEGFLQSSQIVRVHFRGDFKGKNYKKLFWLCDCK